MTRSLAGALLRLSLQALAATWRVETRGAEHMARLRAVQIPTVYAVWHGRFLPVLWRHRWESTTLLVSRHGDGDYLARAAARWGYRVVRGSSTRGAFGGLKGLLRVLRHGGEVALAPDGPTGPPRSAKLGALAIAQRTDAAVVAVGAAASRTWTFRSWDSFMVPRPFARVRIVYRPPFRVQGGRNGLTEATTRLETSLRSATEEAACVW